MSGSKKDFRGTVSERLLADLDRDTRPGCWLWTGLQDKDGYGRITVDGKTQLAHRVSWQLFHPDQPIPDGWCVLHKCDTPPCVNPGHLKIGTNKDNVQDRVRKGRSAKGERHRSHTHPESVPRGERHWKCKLTEADVRVIFHDNIRTQKQIAKEYGVSKSQVNLIKRGKRWRHINMEIE